MKTHEIKRVVVFGLGAAGSNFMLNLIHSHPGLVFAGVDFDIVEARNYEAGTQPYVKSDLGRPKVQAMQRIVMSSRNKKIEMHAVKVLSVSQLAGLVGDLQSSLVVDAFDNAESRNLFRGLAKPNNVLHVGFSPTLTGEAVWAESYSEMTPDPPGTFDVCQNHAARPFIHALSAIASLLASEFIDTGVKRNVYFDSKLKMFSF